MNTKDFETVVNSTLNHCKDVLIVKAREYATEDRLHNFRIAAGLEGVSPRQALAGMMAKHTVSIYDMCNGGNYTTELWDEKICDSINYLLFVLASMAR